MSAYTDYYNQQRGSYHSGAGIEQGKTVRYVKLVFDDSDFERFADILIGKLIEAAKLYDEQSKPWHPEPKVVPKETYKATIKPVNALDEEEDDFAEKYADIPVKTEPTPSTQDPNAWKTYLKPYENNMEKVTISVLIKNWRDFYMYTNEKIVEKFQQRGISVTVAAISHWATGKSIPRKKYHAVIKELLNLSDIEFDNAYQNSMLVARRARFDTLSKG